MEKRNISVIFLITLIGVMGVASITPAFPSIIKHFDLTPTQVTLLITVFTFSGIFLAPVIGILADRYGRKTIILPSLFLFGITGMGCFFTKDWEVLLVLRFFQGMGASSMGMLNVTLIGDIFEGPKRAEIMGYNASVLSIGTATYPALGGALAMAGWQYPFLLTFLAIPTALLVIFWLKSPEPSIKQNLKDYLLRTWKVINQKTVWALFAINTLFFLILYGAYLSYFPQLMEERMQATSLQIGLFMSLLSLTTAITASQLKRINRLIKPKKQLQISFVLFIISMMVLSFANEWWLILVPQITFGLANGMIIPGIQTLMVGFAPITERAGFMSINSMVLRLGQTIGPIIIGIFYALGGTGIAFIGGAIMALIMLIVSVLFVRI